MFLRVVYRTVKRDFVFHFITSGLSLSYGSGEAY